MEPCAALTRRQVLAGLLGAGAAAGLASCVPGGRGPAGPLEGAATESAGPMTGAGRSYRLAAQQVEVDLGGRVVRTWAYGDSVPGPPIRANAGDLVRIGFTNGLPQETSVHWHGLAIRNDMDGVPHVTSDPVPPGGTFGFEFVVPDPGTYWFHPHTGLQTDRGLYAAFIVDDPTEPGGYDAEWVVVLDDWTDGAGPSPQEIYAGLRRSGGGVMGRSGGMHGMAAGDVDYPLYLVNGRGPSDPDVLRAEPGQRVRLRIINAAADTIFDVALGGHDLTVTHSDGYPVEPVTAGSVRIAMGERYDATVALVEGVFPLVAVPLGKSGAARALVRTGSGDAPAGEARPEGLAGPPLTVARLRAAAGAELPAQDPDTRQDVVLAGSMGAYVWTINGRTYDDTVPLTIRQGQAGRLRIVNRSMMDHPVHLHGHTFQLGPAGGTGPRKDTLLVPPMGAAEVDFAASNPGQWMIHCHNAYHAEAGMMTRLDYVS
jgi:FtsP/CotA-like multicopper oxidase with cupredoxin domain